jgi:uncharacterized protein (UPF0335 family)
MPKRKDHVAVTPGGPVTEDMLAGEYFWYSIKDPVVSIARVRRAMKEAGLDDSRLPKERRPEHVVQEACRRVEGTQNNGSRTVIRAEAVLHTGDELIYQITKHVQNKGKRVIDLPRALRVTYSKVNGVLKFEPIDKTPRAEVRDLEERIRDYFENNSTKMPGHRLRTILRHYVEAIGAENMRGASGGVYFMPKRNPLPEGKLRDFHGAEVDGQRFLDGVQQMLEGIYGSPEFHRVPCINDEGQRAFLQRKFIENCDEDLEAYRDELIELVKEKRSRGFRRDLVNNLIERRKQIDARRQKFEGILKIKLTELDRNMDLADQALRKFLEADEKAAA